MMSKESDSEASRLINRWATALWQEGGRSNNDECGTPQDFFDKLNEEFHFTLDPCATRENAKCDKYFTLEQNGLGQSWAGETVFMNPPYSQVREWMRKAHDEGLKPGTTVVCLVYARTDTRWFHDYCYGGMAELRFLRGRLKFTLPGGVNKWSAPAPSMLVIFRSNPDRWLAPTWSVIEND